MNSELEKCKYFFFFVSKKSLQSTMVSLEWKNALFKSKKDDIKFIPVKLDNCIIPPIIAQILYIDLFGQGIEVAIRQMIDVISGSNTCKFEQGFHNIRAYVTQKEMKLIISFKAETYMEPQSRYGILINNAKDDLDFSLNPKLIRGEMYSFDFRETFNDGVPVNAFLARRSSPTSPGFPFNVEIPSKVRLNFIGAIRASTQEEYVQVPITYM